MVSNDEIKRRLDVKKKGFNPIDEVKNDITKNTNGSAEDYLGENILGQITTNTVNRYFQISLAKHGYYTLFFTNKRLMIVETNQYSNLDSLVDFGFNRSITKGKEALNIAEELSKLKPHQIFNSDKPCLSIPYSELKEIRVKKPRYLWKSILSGGLVTIYTPEKTIKYPLNPIKAGIFVWDLVRPDFDFMEELKPILEDKLIMK